MIIYIDIIFLENFIMNLSIILSVAILVNSFNQINRKLFGALVASIIAVLSLFIPIIGFIQILIASIIILISFKITNVKEFCKKISMFYLVSFTYGGIAFSLKNYFNNMFFLFITVFLGYVLLRYILSLKKEHVLKDILISYKERIVELKVLLDTGNLLREPYTNKPVIIVEKNSVKALLSGKDISIFLIPYKTIGNTNGFLKGFKPDFIVSKDTNTKIKNVVIGICDEKISDNGAYSGIFGLKTLDEGV